MLDTPQSTISPVRTQRGEIEEFIKALTEKFPKAFFIDPHGRIPLKTGIVDDLIREGMVDDLKLRRAVSFYESHFAYQYALEAGAWRVDLHGKPVSRVTPAEETKAKEYIRVQKAKFASPAVPVMPEAADSKRSTKTNSEAPVPVIDTEPNATPTTCKTTWKSAYHDLEATVLELRDQAQIVEHLRDTGAKQALVDHSVERLCARVADLALLWATNRDKAKNAEAAQ